MERTAEQLQAQKDRRKILFNRLVGDFLDQLGSTEDRVTRRLKRLGFWDDAEPYLALGSYLDHFLGESFIIDWWEDSGWKVVPGSVAMFLDKFEGLDQLPIGVVAHLNRWGSAMRPLAAYELLLPLPRPPWSH